MPLYATTELEALNNVFIDSFYRYEKELNTADMLEESKQKGVIISSANIYANYISACEYLKQAIEYAIDQAENHFMSSMLNPEKKNEDQLDFRIWLIKELPRIVVKMNYLVEKVRVYNSICSDNIYESLISYINRIDNISANFSTFFCNFRVVPKLPDTSAELSSFRGSYLFHKDTHWYTDDEINRLLHYYLKKNHTVECLTGMLGTTNLMKRNVLIENLKEFNIQRKKLISQGKPVKNRIIIPVNLNENHWVLFYIDSSKIKSSQQKTSNDQLEPFFQQEAANYQLALVPKQAMDQPEELALNSIQYFDPLGGELPGDLRIQLSDLFPNAIITSYSKRLQSDGHNCGPWIVEIAQALANLASLPDATYDIEMARAAHMNIIYPKNKQYIPSLYYVKVNLSASNSKLIEKVSIDDFIKFKRDLAVLDEQNTGIIQLNGTQLHQLIISNGTHSPISSEMSIEKNELDKSFSLIEGGNKKPKVISIYLYQFYDFLRKISDNNSFMTNYVGNSILENWLVKHYNLLFTNVFNTELDNLKNEWAKFNNGIERFNFIDTRYNFLKDNLEQSIQLLFDWDKKSYLQKEMDHFQNLIKNIREKFNEAMEKLPSVFSRVIKFLRDTLGGGLGILLSPIFLPGCFIFDQISGKNTLSSYLDYTVKNGKAWAGLAIVAVIAATVVVPLLHPLVPTIIAVTATPAEMLVTGTAVASFMTILHRKEIHSLNRSHESAINSIKESRLLGDRIYKLNYEKQQQASKERSKQEQKKIPIIAAGLRDLLSKANKSVENETSSKEVNSEGYANITSEEQEIGKLKNSTVNLFNDLSAKDAKDALPQLTELLEANKKKLHSINEKIKSKKSLLMLGTVADADMRQHWQDLQSREYPSAPIAEKDDISVVSPVHAGLFKVVNDTKRDNSEDVSSAVSSTSNISYEEEPKNETTESRIA